jgi:CysZ protein
MTEEFTEGLCFWFRGWLHNFRQPNLLFLCLVPLFLTCLVTVPLLWILFSYLPVWSRDLAGFLLGWSSQFWRDVIFYPLVLSAGLAVLAGLFFCFYLLHALLAIPFYSLLADRVIDSLGKKPVKSASFLRMLRAGIFKTVLLLSAGLAFFLCSFIPGLNLAAIVGATLILAFDVMDYSFESAGFGFRQRLKYFLSHRAQWLGMATGLALTLPIPALTLFVLPGAITGAALILKVNHHDGP